MADDLSGVSTEDLLAQLNDHPVAQTVNRQADMQSKIRARMANLPSMLKSKTAANVASEGMGALDPVLGANSLLDKGVYGLGQLVTSAGGLYPNKVSNWMGEAAHSGEKVSDSINANLQGLRAESGQSGFDPFRLAGNIASPVNAAFPAPASLADAAATGGAFGAVQPTSEGQSPLQPVANAAMGAGGGAAGYGLGRLLSSPQVPTARQGAIDLLRNEGVEPTIGSTLGPGARTLEEKSESVPFVGGAIRKGQNRATEDLNRAVYNRVLAPLGQAVAPDTAPGRQAIATVNQAVHGAYDAALNGARVPYDQQMAGDIQNVVGQAATQLQERQQQLGGWVNRIQETFQNNNGIIGGERLQGLSSNLRREAQNLSHSSDDAARTLGDSITQLNDALMGAARRSNPNIGPALDAANESYMNLVRLNRAAGYNGAAGTGGVFTPSQLVAAVQSAGQGRAAKASGNLPMQDLSDAAAMVLKPTMANSRTADRELAAMGGLLLAHQPHLAAGAGGVWAGSQALYSRPVTSVVNAGLRSQALANALQAAPNITQMAGRIPPALLAQLLQGGAGAPAYGQAP